MTDRYIGLAIDGPMKGRHLDSTEPWLFAVGTPKLSLEEHLAHPNGMDVIVERHTYTHFRSHVSGDVSVGFWFCDQPSVQPHEVYPILIDLLERGIQ